MNGLNKLKRLLLTSLPAALLLVWCSSTLAGDPLLPLSDWVFVDKALTATDANPNPQTRWDVFELPDGSETPELISIPLRDVLVRPGVVRFLEPNGELSDLLYSVTGASLHFWSDGMGPAPTIAMTLPPLGTFTEGGQPFEVGHLFGIVGGPPIEPAMIQVFSDGDVPEPTALALVFLAMVGLLGRGVRSTTRE